MIAGNQSWRTLSFKAGETVDAEQILWEMGNWELRKCIREAILSVNSSINTTRVETNWDWEKHQLLLGAKIRGEKSKKLDKKRSDKGRTKWEGDRRSYGERL